MAPPRAAPKRAYHHGDLRPALIAAAVHILEAEGEAALTLRAVARQVGVSQAAPYHHFADKHAILSAVGEEGFVHLATAMEEAKATAGKKPRDVLRAMGVAYVRFAVKHPSHFRVMFSGILAVGEECGTLHDAANRAFGLLLMSVADAQQAGVLVDGDPAKLALYSWSMVHGLVMLHLNGLTDGPAGPLGSIEELAAGAAEAIARGLEKKTSRA